MNLWKAIRSGAPVSLGTWANYFTFNGLQYPLPQGPTQTLGEKQEEINGDFLGYVQGAYKANGVVFACMLARLLLFSEARFQFRRMQNGRPGELFGSPDLEVLERPWRGGTTGDLLSRAIQDADLAGNFYAVRRGKHLRRLRPDWMTIILGSEDADVDPNGIDVDPIGYLYHPGGRAAGKKPVPLLPEQVAHFAPIPDPEAHFRGMSWITPVIREIMGDGAATTHKLKFFENGATPNLVVKLGDNVGADAFERWVKLFENEHEGVANAYKTLYLGGGADTDVVGANLRQADFKVTQGHGETRIAAAAGVPPVIVGLSEGLQAATYSNYGQARRRFADGTMRPLWRNMAGSLGPIVRVPANAELWYDDRDISFLQEDRQDAAQIQQHEASTIKTLIDAGYKPESVTAAVISGDFSRLEHTGLFSVQLQPPGANAPSGDQEASQILAGLINRSTNGGVR